MKFSRLFKIFSACLILVSTQLVTPLSHASSPAPADSDLGVCAADLSRVRERAAAGTPVMGLRFTGDPLVPRERFERLREELGDRFIAIEIDSRRGNLHGIPRTAHAVLTHHFVDEPGHPTRDALDRVLAFFRERLT